MLHKFFTFILFFFLFIFQFSNADVLRGGVYEEYMPKGFYGSWGVISKLIKTNNPDLFNKESRDVWTLSSYENVLILENFESNAKSKIILKEKNIDNKTLKFQRKRVVRENEYKIIYRETVEFILNGKNFSGSDNFSVEKYDNKDKLLKKSNAIYQVEGVKISGDSMN